MNKVLILSLLLMVTFKAHSQSIPSEVSSRFLGYLNYFNLGDHTGNGGDVVKCKDGTQDTLRMLDLYEVTELHFLNLDVSLGQDFEAYLDELIERLPDDLRDDFKERARNFLHRIKWVTHELQDIPDSKHTYIPNHCEILQIAINHLNGVITIRKDLWNRLDPLNQAVLVMHELMYEDALLSGHNDSVATRYSLSHILAKVRTVSFLEEIQREFDQYSEYELKGTLRFSPYKSLKAKLIHLIMEQKVSIDEETHNYFESLAKSVDYDVLYSGLKWISRRQATEISGEALVLDTLAFLHRQQKIDWKKGSVFFSFLEQFFKNVADNSFPQIFDIFVKVRVDRPTYWELEIISRILVRNASSFTQDQVTQLIAAYDNFSIAVYGEILVSIPRNLTISESFTRRYFEKVRDFVNGPYYLFQTHHFSFFAKRSLYVQELLVLAKKVILNRKSVLSDWNSPFYSFLGDSDLFTMTPFLKEELKVAAMFTPQKNLFPKPLERFYEFFNGSTEPEHIAHILQNYMRNREDYDNFQMLEWLVRVRGERADEIQNTVSHGLRFSQGSSFYRRRLIELLDYFTDFTPLVQSVVALELRKFSGERNLVLALLRLFERRTFSSDLREVFEDFSESQDPEISQLARDLLSGVNGLLTSR